jgi:quercetin dioxygenase-like cupin family protein
MAVEGGVYSRFAEVRPYPIWPGVVARAVHGAELTMALVELEPGTAVAEHHHINEQAGFVVRGTFTFTIDGETRELRPGDSYVIPADVPHSGQAGPAGAVVVDVFSPPRRDWEALDRLPPSPPLWPPD